MKNQTFIVLFALGLFAETTAFGGVASLNSESNIRPVSQYGLIQNVQNYSTNPFWNSNSPYNQQFPQPVYVKGPELNSSDCQTVVGALVSSYCSANNNCAGMVLSDIRPLIMLQLARLPGHNYATACAGYIDSEFDTYVANYSIAVPNGTVAFPGATVGNPDYNASEFKIENPYERKDSTWNGEEWQKEKKERIQELKDLQAQNGAGNEKLVKSDFPETFADLTFSERIDVLSEGYNQWKGGNAYVPLGNIEDEKTYRNRLKEQGSAKIASNSGKSGSKQPPLREKEGQGDKNTPRNKEYQGDQDPPRDPDPIQGEVTELVLNYHAEQ